MPSPRAVGQVSPFPIHTANHGPISVWGDNTARVSRQPAQRDSKRPPRPQERTTRAEEDVRFNTGPRQVRPGIRGGRRPGRSRALEDGMSYYDAVPDYPPPSYTPPASIYPSTTTLLLPQQGIAQDVSSPSSPVQAAPPSPSALPQSAESTNLSHQDYDRQSNTSLEIVGVDRDGPEGEGYTPEVSTFSKSENSSLRMSRGRRVPDSGSDEDLPLGSSRGTRSRRNTLSPLRTLLPHRPTRSHDRTHSAHPTPNSSPYSSHSSFFLSTTSLKLPMSASAISASVRGENSFCRRLLSFKAHERKNSNESLDAWEVVDALDSPTETEIDKREKPFSPPMTSSARSPRSTRTTESPRSQSGTRTPEAQATAPPSPTPPPPEPSIHPLSLRDRKFPLVHHVKKSSGRRHVPPPQPEPVVPQGPIVTTVRTRMMANPPPPARITESTSAPLPQSDRKRDKGNDSGIESSSAFQRALVTPLPSSPVEIEDVFSDRAPKSTPMLADDSFPPTNSPSLPTISTSLLSPSTERDLMTLSMPFTPSPDRTRPRTPPNQELGSPDSRQHYPGRPLPRTPTAARNAVVDSIYGSGQDDIVGAKPAVELQSSDALLIDLEDTSLTPVNSANGVEPSQPSPGPYPPHVTVSTTSSSSSVDLSESPLDSPILPSPNATTTLSSSIPVQNTPNAPFLEVTDLDVLVSRLDGGSRNGSEYEDLVMISDFIGPASPRTVSETSSVTLPDLVESKADPSNENVALLANVEVERQRTTTDGRKRLKLVLIDAPVDRCGICLMQFKDDDLAMLGSICRHAFHEKCLGRWLPTSETCPMCRVPLIPE